MDGTAGNKQLFTQIGIRNTGILHHDLDDLKVEFVKIQFGGHIQFVFYNYSNFMQIY